MAADYPGKIVERLKSAVNNLSLSQSADVGEDDDEIFVLTTAGAPDSGSFHLGNEIVFYPAKSGIKFGPGLTRGADGTTKAIHLKTDAGGEIKFGPEAHFINYLNEEMIAIQTVLGITGSFNFVGKAGNETVAGIKTFSSSPIVPAPTTDLQASTKKYVDDLIATILYSSTIASSATPTPVRGAKRNLFTVTALAEAATLAEPSGTPEEGDTLLIRFKDNGTARAIGHNAIYRAIGITLLTTTVISKTHYEFFVYNASDSKWDCLAVGSEA